MNSLRSLVLATACWAAIWSPAPSRTLAEDIFVNNIAGSDLLRGDTPLSLTPGSGPFKTIQRALLAAGPGDRVVIANTGEPYRECVTLQGGANSGIAGAPFIVEGNGAVLDGSAPTLPDRWRHFRGEVFTYQPERVAHQQLFLDGRPLPRRPTNDDGSLPALEELEWCLFQQAIAFRPQKGRHPTTYNLACARHPVGLGLYEVRHVEVRDLVVQGYQLDGVNAHDSAFDISLVGVVARGNGRSGVSIGGASRVTLSACLLGDNGVVDLRTEGRSQTKIVNCDIIGRGVPAILQDGGVIVKE